MRILISSLQVSESGSKGHLHPAVELALEAKRKGHEVAILPLPSRLGKEDALQLQRANIQYIPPPLLPTHIIKSPNELAQLAADPTQVHRAYSSFLIEPIVFQKKGIEEILERFDPDAILYDLLVYSAPLIGRKLGIPDIGYCAGLKLIAPESLLGIYAEVAKKLRTQRDKIVQAMGDDAHFHHMELLSNNGQFVFAPEKLFAGEQTGTSKTIFAGALPISENRSDQKEVNFEIPQNDYVVLSFGSVLDPADFPHVTQAVIKTTQALGLKLLIGSRKMARMNDLPNHVKTFKYLPLSQLIASAKAYIHHGGANSFSEALRLGARQVLIPLTTDQPIQAHYLNKIEAGISLEPKDVTESSIRDSIIRLSNKEDRLRVSIENVSREYQESSGATAAIMFMENMKSERNQ
ncbi:MAG: glycosyltransferase family 1 protein [Bdellovibrionales bacterium]|nr:glycosyltransferase family 1 protein [Bdellovibrionales bacterium]